MSAIQLPNALEGRWQVIRELRRGGQAAPLLVRSLADQSEAVLKMPGRTDSRSLERFSRELTILKGADHPAVAPVIEYGFDNEMYWYITPYGRPLDEIWRELRNRMQPMALLGRSLSVIRTVAAGLQYCHTRSPAIYHRDIKPANIICLGEEDAQPVIIDFGIAYLEGADRLTSTLEPVGNTMSRHPQAAYGRLEIPGEWLDVRSVVLTWAWMLSAPPHRFS